MGGPCKVVKVGAGGRGTACKTTLQHTNKKMWADKKTQSILMDARKTGIFSLPCALPSRFLVDLEQALSLQILVGLFIDHVAAGVLVLLLEKTTTPEKKHTMSSIVLVSSSSTLRHSFPFGLPTVGLNKDRSHLMKKLSR